MTEENDGHYKSYSKKNLLKWKFPLVLSEDVYFKVLSLPKEKVRFGAGTSTLKLLNRNRIKWIAKPICIMVDLNKVNINDINTKSFYRNIEKIQGTTRKRDDP